MKMGQVWSKADFDGISESDFAGGRGSVLAVTAQNPGPDGVFSTVDDVTAPLNAEPTAVSIDRNSGPDCNDPLDRVRGFYSFHRGGANFLMGDGSVNSINDSIDLDLYRALSTIAGEEVTEPGF